jgi:hypothetical protein
LLRLTEGRLDLAGQHEIRVRVAEYEQVYLISHMEG